MKLGFLFPGQGAQYVGMGKSLYETRPESRAIFEKADKILGFSLTRIMFEGPKEQLMRTDICQPAIFLHSLAALAALRKEAPQIQAVVTAGLSLGEYSALASAGVLSFSEGLRLVRTRGRLMQEASEKNPGGLVLIMGLSLESVKPLCEKSGTVIANLNSPDQVVVAGDKAALEKVSTLAREAGARRALALDVAGAFHSPLMDEAADGLGRALDKVDIQPPKIEVFSNLTGQAQADPSEIRLNLRRQVNHLTRWIDCFRAMVGQGIGQFIEIGPGKVLKGLARKIAPDASVMNVEDSKGVEGVFHLKGSSP